MLTGAPSLQQGDYANVFDGSTTTLQDGSTVSLAACFNNSKCTTWTIPTGINYVAVEAWAATRQA